MSSTPARPESRPRILIIDRNKLRQAGIMHLLEAWAELMGLSVIAVQPDTPLKKGRICVHCKLVILSLGSASVEDSQQRALIENIRTLVPEAPLVIISDREDPEEVCAAFQEGAAGFMPTSIDPSVALQALTFIKGGGSFFPPSALLQYPVAFAPRMRSVGRQAVSGLSCASQLTIRQKDVFNLLQQGVSNKTIARRLGMSAATVKVHVRCIMRKFGVANRTQLVIAAMNESSLMMEVNTKERDQSEKFDAPNVTRLAVTAK
jgi:DNA-binding NarL/FixJ family response regulator